MRRRTVETVGAAADARYAPVIQVHQCGVALVPGAQFVSERAVRVEPEHLDRDRRRGDAATDPYAPVDVGLTTRAEPRDQPVSLVGLGQRAGRPADEIDERCRIFGARHTSHRHFAPERRHEGLIAVPVERSEKRSRSWRRSDRQSAWTIDFIPQPPQTGTRSPRSCSRPSTTTSTRRRPRSNAASSSRTRSVVAKLDGAIAGHAGDVHPRSRGARRRRPGRARDHGQRRRHPPPPGSAHPHDRPPARGRGRAATSRSRSLWASEGKIYQRYGYGLAAQKIAFESRSSELTWLAPAASDAGRRRAVSSSDTHLFREVYESVWRERPGHSSARRPLVGVHHRAT